MAAPSARKYCLITHQEAILYAPPDRSLVVISAIPVICIGAALVVTHFSVDIANYLALHAVPKNTRIIEQVSRPANGTLSRSDLPAEQPVQADRVSAPVDLARAAQVQQIAPGLEAQDPPKQNSLKVDRSEESTRGIAEIPTRQTTERHQLSEDTKQQRQVFDEERARSAINEAMQQKQAAEVAVAELRQSLQQEQQKTVALTREAKAAQAITIDAEVQRRALASELAETVREIDARIGQSQRAADEAMQQRQAAEVTVADLRQSLQQEQQRSVGLSQEARAMQATARAAEHQRRAFEQVQARAAALASELVDARRETETRTALSQRAVDEAVRQREAAEVTVAELRRALQQEQETAQTKETKAVQAMTTAAEGQQRTLEVVRARAAALASELAGMPHEIEARAAQSQEAIDEAMRQKQAAEVTVVELRQALRQEQEKTAVLTREAEVAQAEVAIAAKVQQRTLVQVQARASSLASELAEAQHESETRAAQSQRAAQEAMQQKQTEIAAAQQSFRQERNRAEPIERDLASARSTMAAREVRQPVDAVYETAAVNAAAIDAPKVANKQDDTEAARLMARASVLLGQGNIGAARVVLERALENGNARASFMLAETYDPVILSSWGTHGTRGEVGKAREHYEKANAGGIREARNRLDALSR